MLLSRIKNIPHLSKDEFPKVPVIIDGMSIRFIRNYLIIPMEQDLNNNTLVIVMANPEDTETIDALRVATGVDFVTVYGGEKADIEDYITRFYSQESSNINKIIEDIEDIASDVEDEDEADIGHLKDLASEAPIIKLVNLIITRAVENRASDIHIEPFEDELKVRYRIDGVLHDI